MMFSIEGILMPVEKVPKLATIIQSLVSVAIDLICSRSLTIVSPETKNTCFAFFPAATS